jgi:putative membrane protein
MESPTKIHKLSAAGGVLAILYIVGLLGISNLLPIPRGYFVALSPLHLIICFLVVSVSHHISQRIFIHPYLIVWAWIIAVSGFIIEIIGINTTYPFGEYYYGETLGFKCFDVPLVIGINWLMLTYSTRCLLDQFYHLSWISKSLLGGLIMVSLDVFIEPIAQDLGYWSWMEPAESLIVAPYQNYLSWFVISAIFIAISYRLLPNKINNYVAIVNLLLQFLFFIFLNLI